MMAFDLMALRLSQHRRLRRMRLGHDVKRRRLRAWGVLRR